jgi:hypothetical protein
MPRKNSTDLFYLIKSLDKNQKGYIKKYSVNTKEKLFLKLFDAIDKQKVYDEENLFIDKAIIKQLPRLKIYLYEFILAALNAYYSGKNISGQIKKILNHISVLYNKGLYDQAIKQLNRVKRMAVTYEKFNSLMEVYEWERTLMVERQLTADFERVEKEEEATIAKIKNLAEYKNAYECMSKLYMEIIKTRNKTELNALKMIVRHKRFSGDDKAQSVMAKMVYYKTLSKYCSAFDDLKTYEIYSGKVVRLMEENPHLIAENVNQYIKVLNNHIAITSENGNLKDYESSLLKLKSIPEKHRHSDVRNLKRIVKLRVLVREFYHSLHRRNFERALVLAKEMEKILESQKQSISENHTNIFMYQIAYVYFINADYKKTIHWCYKIINSPVSSNKIFFLCFARLLALYAHYEMNNKSPVRYLLNETRRFTAKWNKVYSLEKMSFDFFDAWLKQSKRRNENVIEKLYEATNKSFNKMENTVLEYFNIHAWVLSKLQKRTFLEVLKSI